MIKLYYFLRYLNRFGLFRGTKLYFQLKVIKLSSFNVSRGLTLFLRPNSSDIDSFEQVFLDRQYFLKDNLNRPFIIDAGANIGFSSIFFNELYKDAKIVSIEPDSRNFEFLVRNVKYHNNINVIKAALWPRADKLTLVRGCSNDSHTVEHSKKNYSNVIESITIDDILKKYCKQVVDILKIDIEGSEKELFSFNYDIWLPKVRFLLIETHDRMKEGCSKSLFSALSDYNFSLELNGEIMIFRNNNLSI